MVKVQDFTAGNFEENLQRLGERVEALRSASWRTQGETHEIHPEILEHQIVKEALKYEPREAQSVSVSAGSDGVSSSALNVSLLPDYFEGGDEDGMREAVQRLAETALHGDLKRSLQEARKLSPYLLDAFHDALVDKVLPEMKRRGMI